MGKGDKKTKRGKIVIGSPKAKAEPKAKVKTEPKVAPKPKKTTKKKVDE